LLLDAIQPIAHSLIDSRCDFLCDHADKVSRS
jgi:hypothetical protein